MTWVDLVVLGVLAVSALLAFMRGFVREVLGIGAWVAAVLVAIWAFPYARPQFREWLGTPDLVDPVTFAVVFVVTLLVLLLICHWIGALVRGSVLGGVDRTLGLVFGLVRGAALVVFAYIAAGLVVPVDRWPDPVLQARSLPAAYAGAAWAAAQLPPDYRPKLQPPPAGRQTTAEDLLRAAPVGRATNRPLARD
ncbi:MAG: CvpA family protein [Alphaproteobacteria bacterium]|nr:CvpA family protein [Alphaproteobacteria bacterium]